MFRKSRMFTDPSRASRPMIFMVLAVVLATAYAMPLKYETAQKSSHSSGIKGTIVATGNCPGPQRKGDNSCGPHPYEGALAVRRSADQEVAATGKSDRKGEFCIAVPPGKYFITQAGDSKYPIIHSDEIVVVKHEFTMVKLSADLGMR